MQPFVINRVAESYRPSKQVARGDLKWIVIHRCDLSTKTEANPEPIENAFLTASRMSEAFKNPGMGTGGLMPYHGLVLADGRIEQAVPLSRRGSHAKGVNWCSLSWAVIGHKEHATKLQFDAVVRVATFLVMYARGNVGMLRGHDEIPGGSADPNKVCPGPVIDMQHLREAVSMRLPPDLQDWPTSRILSAVQETGLILEG